MLTIPIIDMIKTGQNIVKLRQENGLSVKELQEMFGFATPQAIYKWQQGISVPSIDNLIVLAQIFQVHMDDIIVIYREKDIAVPGNHEFDFGMDIKECHCKYIGT